MMNNLEKMGQKITLTLLVSQSLFSAALIISFTVSAIIVVELAGGDKRWAGVPTTLVLVGAAAMAAPLGRLMDRFGRRPGLSLGYLFGVLGSLLAGWAVIIQSLPLFLGGAICLGFNRSANDLGRYAAAEANPIHRRARAISWVVMGGTFGSIAGPFIVEWISDQAEGWAIPLFSIPWFAAAAILLLALLLLNIFLRPDPQTIAQEYNLVESDPVLDAGPGRAYRDIFRQPHTKMATGAMVCGQLAMVAVMVITPIHMHDHNHAIGSISWVIMAHTLGMFGLSFMTGWLVDRVGPIRMIVGGGLVLALSCLMAPLWDSVGWLALSLFLLGLGWNFCFVAGSSLLTSVLRANEKGRIQGTTDALVYIASGSGSIGSGFVLNSFGFLMMSWLTIIIAVIPILLVFWLSSRPPSEVALEGTV